MAMYPGSIQIPSVGELRPLWISIDLSVNGLWHGQGSVRWRRLQGISTFGPGNTISIQFPKSLGSWTWKVRCLRGPDRRRMPIGAACFIGNAFGRLSQSLRCYLALVAWPGPPERLDLRSDVEHALCSE